MNPVDFFQFATFKRDEYLDAEIQKFLGAGCDRVQFVLEGRIPSKKNSRVTVRKTGRSFPSPEYEAWHEAASIQIMKYHVPRKSLTKLKAVVVIIFFPDDRTADLTNKAESVMDLMVDTGIIADDRWQNTGPVMLIPKYSPGHAGAIVDLFIMEEPCLKFSPDHLFRG